MQVSVVGSRSFTDYSIVSEFLDRLAIKIGPLYTIVSGGARGADSLAARFARENNYPLKEIKPDWKKFGKAAGFVRNTEIVTECDFVVAFWDGESRGTKDSLDKAKEQGKEAWVVKPDKSYYKY